MPAIRKQSLRQFEEQVRFNWGFHDAARDWQDGRPRALYAAKQSLSAVSPHFDRAYHNGYEAGLDYSKAGLPTESSAQAWVERGRS